MATYVEDIIQALKNLGGQAKLEEIYDEVNRIRKVPQTKNWKFNISGIIGNHCSDSTRFMGKEYFRKVDKGTYALSDQAGIKTPRVNVPTKVNRAHDSFPPSESFETIVNCLRTIKEYRDYSGSLKEYIQEFFHVLGFHVEEKESRLYFLKDMNSDAAPLAIVGMLNPGENFVEITPGVKWETYIRFAANNFQVKWGILINGLQLKIFYFGELGIQSPSFWPDLDGIITHEKSVEFFEIYKVFSAMKGSTKKFDRSQDTRSKTKVVVQKPNQKPRLSDESTDSESTKQFIDLVLKKQFGVGFRKLGRSYLYESDSKVVFFQNCHVDKDQWWYRVSKKARQGLVISKKQTWLCLTNIPSKSVYIFPMKAVEEQVKRSGWKEEHLEISIYPNRSLWHQLKWNIEKYRFDFR